MRMAHASQTFSAVRSVAMGLIMLGTGYLALWTLGVEFPWRAPGGFLVLPIAVAILLVTEVRRSGVALAAKRIAVFILLCVLLACSIYALAWAWERGSVVALFAVAALIAGSVWAFKHLFGAYADWSEETLQSSSVQDPPERTGD